MAPAKVFNLPGGSLRRGTVADITIFDPSAQWTVDPDRFLSKGRNSPYRGKRLTGRATCTIVGGRVVFKADGGGRMADGKAMYEVGVWPRLRHGPKLRSRWTFANSFSGP